MVLPALTIAGLAAKAPGPLSLLPVRNVRGQRWIARLAFAYRMGPMLNQIAGDPHIVGAIFGFAFGGLFGHAARSMVSHHHRQQYRRRRGC